ncbi:hypothetical protein DKP78_18175, partial [Enterococcus faecium]
CTTQLGFYNTQKEDQDHYNSREAKQRSLTGYKDTIKGPMQYPGAESIVGWVHCFWPRQD